MKFNFTEQKEKIKELINKLFQSRFEKDLKSYQSEMAQNPSDTRLRMKIAETYFKAKNIDAAVEEYQAIAEAYEAENFMLKAVAVYKNILKIKPAMVEVNLKLAEIYKSLNMVNDAAIQYKIAMQFYDVAGQKDPLIETAKKLLALNPSANNRRRLAETYQNLGMNNEALEQYEILAREYRLNKNYDDLLRVYELIVPHKPKNQPLVRDLCILYLRKQEPEKALRAIDKYQVDAEPEFAPVLEKAKLMREALKKQARA